MLGDIARGTQTLAKGLGYLKHREIRQYVLIPLAINLILFGSLIWFGFSRFAPLVEWLMSFLPQFLDFLRWILWIFLGLLTAVIAFFTFTPIANIIAAPFNALMSEKLEILLTGSSPSSDLSFMQMAIVSMKSQIRKLGYVFFWYVGLLLITIIPVANLAAPVLWVLFGSWLMALEYMDYPMGNHDIDFREQRQTLAERRGLAMGFGGAVMIMTTIPVVNFLAMPAATAGATVLWVEQFRNRGLTQSD